MYSFKTASFNKSWCRRREEREWLERFPTGWDHPVDKKSLSFQ
jgi:hypothetical protein